ncbi:hypothetical protein, partial [Methylobacterium sp. J-070]|uniref:hypothetical protein n=1 Tax=Methylobacterium sp. J-070 TaxID=2836650 RepID=UPI001FBA8A39
CRLHLDLAQLQHHLLRARLLTSPHVRLLRSWLILSISPVQSQPVRSTRSPGIPVRHTRSVGYAQVQRASLSINVGRRGDLIHYFDE